VVSIDVYSLNWMMTTRANLTADDVLSWQGTELNMCRISDRSTLKFISNKLQKLIPIEGYNEVDVRMVCILHYSDSSTERLLFSAGTQLAQYSGVVYDRDSSLVQVIEKDCIKNSKMIFKMTRIQSTDSNQFEYLVEISKGEELLITETDFIKELKNKSLEIGEIVAVKKLSSSAWNVKTKR